MDLSDKQYGVLLELYHEFQYAFNSLDREIKNTFFERLYAKWELTPSLTAELSQ